MKDDDDDFEDFETEDDSVVMDAAPDTITVRNERFRKSWREIERLREERELEKLNQQDSWFDDLDRSL